MGGKASFQLAGELPLIPRLYEKSCYPLHKIKEEKLEVTGNYIIQYLLCKHRLKFQLFEYLDNKTYIPAGTRRPGGVP